MQSVIAFIFGSMIGSFLNVCIYRLPKGESVVLPGSHCGACGKPVRWFDNLPVISYFLLRGKCRDCGAKFSVQHALIEALTGLLFVLFFTFFGVTPLGFIYLAFTLAMLVQAMIDLEHKIIPDVITLPGVVIGLILSACFPLVHAQGSWFYGLKSSFMGMMTGALFFYLVAVIAEKLMKREAMGGGDIKLLAMIGAFLGVRGVIYTVFLGSCLGSMAGIYFKLKKREPEIPFGPFLGLGAFIYIFFDQRILAWYADTISFLISGS